VKASALSELAASFPTVEVEYEDMLLWQHRTDARGGGYTDCLQVVLEIYRRAGIGLGNYSVAGDITSLYLYFNEVEDGGELYDVAYLEKNTPHVWVVVRPGTALSSARGSNVTTKRVSELCHRDRITWYRMRPECYP
jgi:hypothetical protein